MIVNSFPELNVQLPKRHAVPWGHWSNRRNQRAFLDDLARKLSILTIVSWLTDTDIREPNDWYNVSLQQVAASGGLSMLSRHKHSLITALKTLYPDHPWKEWKFSRPHNVARGKSLFSKTQYLLFQYVQRVSSRCRGVLPLYIFPGMEIEFNFKYFDYKKAGVTRWIEFDVSNTRCAVSLHEIFIPSLSLALEYNGEAHYMNIRMYLYWSA